jgi:hypothetical protein
LFEEMIATVQNKDDSVGTLIARLPGALNAISQEQYGRQH